MNLTVCTDKLSALQDQYVLAMKIPRVFKDSNSRKGKNMRTVEVKSGSIGDITKVFYMAINEPFLYIEADPVLICGPVNYKIIYKHDSGCYPGTLGQVSQLEYNHIVDELLDQGIIERDKNGFFKGRNYRDASNDVMHVIGLVENGCGYVACSSGKTREQIDELKKNYKLDLLDPEGKPVTWDDIDNPNEARTLLRAIEEDRKSRIDKGELMNGRLCQTAKS